MGKFTFHKTEIEGVIVIEPTVFGDNRGYFMETYQQEEFQAGGVDTVFVQDNQSKSRKGVLRGLHFQKNYPQGKLVRVINGEVFDVAVDLRKGSKTYGNGLALFFLPKTKSSFIFQKALHMVFWCCLKKRNLFINAMSFIIRKMKADLHGTINLWAFTGRFRKIWKCY